MYNTDINLIYKFAESCADEYLLPEELSYRGFLTLIEYFLYDNSDNNDIFLNYIFFRRFDIQCQEILEPLFIHLYSVKREVVDNFIIERMNILNKFISRYKGKLLNSNFILLVDESHRKISSIKILYKYLKSIVDDLHIIYIPQLFYLLNIFSLISNEKHLNSLRSIFSEVDSNLLFLDTHIKYVFDELDISSSKTYSISTFIKDLVFNKNVYIEKTYDMNIGIVKTCSFFLGVDYKNYMDVLKTIPNINISYSKRCIVSGYFNYLPQNNISVISNDLIDSFDFPIPKIILTYDPYLYGYLVKYLKGKTYAIGFLPNLIVRYMRKI